MGTGAPEMLNTLLELAIWVNVTLVLPGLVTVTDCVLLPPTGTRLNANDEGWSTRACDCVTPVPETEMVNGVLDALFTKLNEAVEVCVL